MPDSSTTLQSELAEVQSERELHVIDGSGERHYLLTEAEFEFEAAGEFWRVQLDSSESAVLVMPSGDSRQLRLGHLLIEEGLSLSLIDPSRPPIGVLYGVSDPCANRRWSLWSEGAFPIGRPGKRWNHIQLDDATVSRAHATLLVSRGEVFLRVDTPKATTALDGKALHAESQTPLPEQALLQLGSLLFRWQANGRGPQTEMVLTTLGGFALTLNNKEVQLKNDKARWLLARLATWPDRALPVGPILRDNWPEVEALRARKNLSHTLGVLRSALAMDTHQFNRLLWRDPNSLRLSPEVRLDHDLLSLQAQLKRRQQSPEETELSRASWASSGAFLPSCDQPWACAVRRELEALL